MRSDNLLFRSMLMLILALAMGGCGDSGNSNAALAPKVLLSIAVTPSAHSLSTGQTQQFSATGTFSDGTSQDLTTAAAWSSTDAAVATINNAGLATAVAAGSTAITATSGDVKGSTTLTVTSAAGVAGATERNVMPVTVNGSLCSANSYPNKPCVAVTVCIPGTTTCTTINDILLDTGSFGLRLFKQPLGLELPAAPGASGELAECIQFADGTSEWGPIRMASVTLGNEPAINIPIHVFDTSFGTRSTACLDADPDPATAGFNGILGVGLFPQDCGSRCANAAANGMYFSCNGTSCIGTTVAVADQVKNPVAFLPQDNNGILVRFPAVSATGAPSVDGSLIFGIGTQPNNTPTAVKTFAVNQFGEITTVFNGVSNGSFIDSGSNGLFFPQPAQPPLPPCPSPFAAWYCPPEELPLSATVIAAAGVPTAEIPFRVGNFLNLTATGNRVFNNIGGPSHGNIFDWGFPFFLGRDVFIGIEGKGTNLGNGPFWAF
ncbi:lipoprotein of unknown function DUF3443 [Geotalea daltonii FRC-32]|uniref:BIG2 domain-containing protein n=1 Tax=Geotalea daltonii (strain DSM 22248 / JCM 15807 / FRC-32) TaxID=316067 RepID=B9M7J5_GEODF|nr:DUF3443 family protein [Geotalea daltonii]ACM22101.1 lipoprotein of unknown function DUF3443 [Geotalea daltonii FRC-32]